MNGRGVQLGVPEQLLDEPDVGPALQHVRGARVAQEMATALETQHPQPLAHHPA